MLKLLAPNNRPIHDGPPAVDAAAPKLQAVQINLRGRVQGFGVRPAIARLAQELQLTGYVGNCQEGVVIHIEGDEKLLQAFQCRLQSSLPQEAVVSRVEAFGATPAQHSRFDIKSSHKQGSLSAFVPPDVMVCSECLADVSAVGNRRFGYVFTTCTRCGPRYSLIQAMPYDREATGMVQFTPCRHCRDEYIRLNDRRFHSQTNSCPECGPQVWLADRCGQTMARHEAALDRTAAALREGKIVAIKGIGGYQLAVDATSSAAVEELRRRKQRFGKPLAVMAANLAAAEQLAIFNDAERKSLTDPTNPIVVTALRMPSRLASEVTGGLPTVGLMLPTTPLHEFLIRRVSGPLIVTSGNLEGEPLAFDAVSAHELSQVAELWLHHDRPILRAIDDSVVQIVANRQAAIRLGRGLAPLPLQLESDRAILALGGHQKTAIALTNGAQAVLGPHVGDLENEGTRGRYLEHVDAMCKLYGAKPTLLVHDLHPDYFTSRWAAEQPTATMAVQHHHAHIVAGMLEHGWLDRQVLGVAWDGTGYGGDGTIWGGEFLLTTATDFSRVGSLLPFLLPGGDAAVREPWRVAVSLVYQSLGSEAAAQLRFSDVGSHQIERLVHLLRHPRLCHQTSSAGRLFDGVAALALGTGHIQFEAQAAMLLEAACDLSCADSYNVPLSDREPMQFDWRPMMGEILTDLKTGLSTRTIATKFHRALANAIVTICARFSNLPVVCSGGCFNNRLLVELVAERMGGRTERHGLPGVIPVNDGGLAAGQLAVAAARTKQKVHTRLGTQPCA